MERGANRFRLIELDLQIDPAGDRCLQFGQQVLHAIDGLDDVGARLSAQHDQYRRLAIGRAGIAHILDGIMNFGDVVQIDGRAIVKGDDQITEFLGRPGLVIGMDQPAVRAIVQKPLGSIGIGTSQRLADLLEAEAILVGCIKVEFDADRRQGGTAQLHLADAVDLGKFLSQHRGGGVVHLPKTQDVGCE